MFNEKFTLTVLPLSKWVVKVFIYTVVYIKQTNGNSISDPYVIVCSV